MSDTKGTIFVRKWNNISTRNTVAYYSEVFITGKEFYRIDHMRLNYRWLCQTEIEKEKNKSCHATHFKWRRAFCSNILLPNDFSSTDIENLFCLSTDEFLSCTFRRPGCKIAWQNRTSKSDV